MQKRKILMTPQAAHNVETLKTRQKPTIRKTYTDRLAALQAMADRLADEIELADADVGKRLNWLREYAKILRRPLATFRGLLIPCSPIRLVPTSQSFTYLRPSWMLLASKLKTQSMQRRSTMQHWTQSRESRKPAHLLRS